MAPSLITVGLILSSGSCATYNQLDPAALQPEVGELVYHTDVRFDLVTATLDVRATLVYVATNTTAAKPQFLLNRGLQLQSVTGVAVRSYRVETFDPVPVWNVVEVELDDAVTTGSIVTIEMNYAGSPELPENGINGIDPRWVELNLDSQWHPLFASFDRTMRGVLRLQLPPEWQVAGSGPASLENGVHVIHNIVPQPDVAFAAAPSFEQLRSGNFIVYFREAAPETAAAALEAGENCAAHLNERYGARDQLPRAKLVLADRDGPGYARKNYIVLSQIEPEDTTGLHYFLCHELAHYWTPSPGPFSPDHWMSEAFAEYVAVRYLREHFGEEPFNESVDRWDEMGRAHGPVWTPELQTQPNFFVMYRRAPHLLHRLEQRIGEDLFDRFLGLYMTKDVRTTPDLLDRLAAVAGPEAARWFRRELARGPEAGS